MAESSGSARSATIMRIADGAIFTEVALVPGNEEGFEKARAILPQLKEFDKKRKDHGKVEEKDGILHYEIDSESIAHIFYTDKLYSDQAARAFLKELVSRFEKAVDDPSDADAEKVKRSLSGPTKDLLNKYKIAPDLQTSTTTVTDEKIKGMGMKVDQAKDQLAKQLQQAASNEQDLRMIDDRTKRTKLMASEMEYESEGLSDSMANRNRILMIVGGLVAGALILAIIIAVVK